MTETVYKTLGRVRAKTGHQLKLGPFDEIIRVSFDDDNHQVRVTMRVADYTEQARAYVVRRTGLRMICYTPSAGRLRWEREIMEVWDEDSGYTVPKGDYTPGRYEEREAWAELCDRPGTAKTPLDSWSKSANDPIHTPAKMQKHWAPSRYTT